MFSGPSKLSRLRAQFDGALWLTVIRGRDAVPPELWPANSDAIDAERERLRDPVEHLRKRLDALFDEPGLYFAPTGSTFGHNVSMKAVRHTRAHRRHIPELLTTVFSARAPEIDLTMRTELVPESRRVVAMVTFSRRWLEHDDDEVVREIEPALRRQMALAEGGGRAGG